MLKCHHRQQSVSITLHILHCQLKWVHWSQHRLFLVRKSNVLNDPKLFSNRSLREEKEVSLLGWRWKKIAANFNCGEKAACLLRLVQDSARLKWAALISSYKGSNSRLCNRAKKKKKKEKKTVKRQAHTETQWDISRPSFFIYLIEGKIRFNAILRSQISVFYFSYKVSYFQRSPVTRHRRV